MACVSRENVAQWGGFADYVYLHPKTWDFKIPQGMSLERAVQTEPIATGLRAVERAYYPGEAFMGEGYGVGSRAMVVGTGPIGIMAIVGLRESGADLIIAQDLIQSRLDMAKRIGADMTIYRTRPLEQRLQQVQDATDGIGPDVVIEAAGSPVALQESLAFVHRGGKLIEVGHYTDPGTIDMHPFTICFKDLDLHGSWAYPPIMFKYALSALSRTSLPVDEVVSYMVPLEELPKAMELVGKEGGGKIAVHP